MNRASICVLQMNKKAGIHMNETMNLQDAILKEVRRDKVPVTLF